MPYVEVEVSLQFLRSGTTEVNLWLHTSTAFFRTDSLPFLLDQKPELVPGTLAK